MPTPNGWTAYPRHFEVGSDHPGPANRLEVVSALAGTCMTVSRVL